MFAGSAKLMSAGRYATARPGARLPTTPPLALALLANLPPSSSRAAALWLLPDTPPTPVPQQRHNTTGQRAQRRRQWRVEYKSCGFWPGPGLLPSCPYKPPSTWPALSPRRPLRSPAPPSSGAPHPQPGGDSKPGTTYLSLCAWLSLHTQPTEGTSFQQSEQQQHKGSLFSPFFSFK